MRCVSPVEQGDQWPGVDQDHRPYFLRIISETRSFRLVAGLSAEGFMDLLGKAGVAAVGYPPSELEDEFRNAL